MNFLKSVFSDDPDPDFKSESSSSKQRQQQQQEHDSDLNSPPTQQEHDQIPNRNPDSSTGWSFGGLIKTLSERSESVIETYRRDLKEFGSGLKKEIEAAHGSFETVSTKIDELGSSVLKNTAQIISQGKDAILAADQDSDSSDANSAERSFHQRSLGEQRYSRLDAQVRAIQGDLNTYCEEPEDLEDYEKWKRSGFVLDEKTQEIERLMEENGVIESVYKKVVPISVDHETFWCRYFFKVYKLKQAEEARVSLVKRAISGEEEELSWDVDDEEEGENERGVVSKVNAKGNEKLAGGDSGKYVKDEGPSQVEGSVGVSEVGEKASNVEVMERDEKGIDLVSKHGSSEVVGEKGEKVTGVENAERGSVVESKRSVDDEVKVEKSVEKINDPPLKADEKVTLEGKDDNGGSNKDSDMSIISSQPTVAEEEDLGWDEIEDLSSIDEKSERKVSQGGSPNRADLRKRLSAAEEEEDLSWDIEDDDEPVKA